MSASTLKRFTQSASEQFDSATAEFPAAGKFGAIASRATAEILADAVNAVSLNAAASIAWAADAKAMGRAAVPW